jgi:hypothetical protein
MSPTFDEVEKLQIEMMRILEDLPTHEPYHKEKECFTCDFRKSLEIALEALLNKLKVVSNAEYPQN